MIAATCTCVLHTHAGSSGRGPAWRVASQSSGGGLPGNDKAIGAVLSTSAWCSHIHSGRRHIMPKKQKQKQTPTSAGSREKYTVLKDTPVRKTAKPKADQNGMVRKGQVVIVDVRIRLSHAAVRNKMCII